MSFKLEGKHIDTLVALVENGPLEDGDVPSKSGRDDLIDAGYAVRIVQKGSDGWTAATYEGRNTYCKRYGNAATMKEAKANRLMQRAIHVAQHKEGT